MKKNILVTGCRGFIGSVLVPRLQCHGYHVTGLDIDYYRDATIGPGLDEIPMLRCDIRDVEASQLHGFDAIIHLAALSNDPLGNLDSQLTFDINQNASIRLAELAKASGVPRFLFSSSCSTYGAAGDELLTETAEFHPITPYGESKVNADREISKLSDESFSPTLLRNATAYGFSPRLRLDLVVNDFAAAAFLERRIYIKSDGTPWRPLVHVEDICGAFEAILKSPREAVHNQAFNVGSTSENYRVSELAEIVKQAVPDCVIEYDPAGGPDKRCYRVNCDKIRQLIPDFQPKWNVAKGVEQLLQRFQEFGLSTEDVSSGKFLRLAALQRRRDAGEIDPQLRLCSPSGASS